MCAYAHMPSAIPLAPSTPVGSSTPFGPSTPKRGTGKIEYDKTGINQKNNQFQILKI